MNKTINQEIASYYDEKITKFGTTPQGVDWNGEDGQNQRFKQICKVIQEEAGFSIVDLGCGYGALVKFLNSRYKNFEYLGLDLSRKMIEEARLMYPNQIFEESDGKNEKFDYVLASGIFNVKQDKSEDIWYRYIIKTLIKMHSMSEKGFAFNCLTKYSDEEKKREYLYYCDPCQLFDYCKTHFSRNVALLHDYDLYEFTILVKK